MHIKFINCSPLNFGIKVLLIASLLYSCSYSSTIVNPELIISSDEDVPNKWTLEESQNFTITKSFIDSQSKPFLKSTVPGSIRLSQTLRLDAGSYFVLAKYTVNIQQGSFFIRAGSEKGIKLYSPESICYRIVFTFTNNHKKDVKIEFGFEDGTIADALVEAIEVRKVNYEFSLDNKDKIDLINDTLSINIKADEYLDYSIDMIAASINTAFLSTDESFTSFYNSDVFNDPATSYLSTYISDNNIQDSYCQKASLSLDELLRLYNIPTRQLHWQKNCSGFHQFLEYWNAYDKKWKIIDPFYGIRYVNSSGEYLGFEDIEKLVREGDFTKEYIKQIDIGHLYYSENEVLNGWMNAGLAVHVLNKE